MNHEGNCPYQEMIFLQKFGIPHQSGQDRGVERQRLFLSRSTAIRMHVERTGGIHPYLADLGILSGSKRLSWSPNCAAAQTWEEM